MPLAAVAWTASVIDIELVLYSFGKGDEMSSAKPHPGVVVGIDRSGSANIAVRWAAREATLRKVALTLVPVRPLPAFGASARVWATAPTADELHEWREEEVHKIFADAIKAIEDDADGGDLPEINSELLYSAPVPTLVDMSIEAQIVVVGYREQGPEAGLAPLGSGRTSLVHLSPIVPSR